MAGFLGFKRTKGLKAKRKKRETRSRPLAFAKGGF
jgi:hypothetical protein